MADLESLQKKLESLAGNAGPKGWRPGMSGNPNACELEVGQALMGAVLNEKAVRVVEIGTGRGYSTCWLLIGALKNIAKGIPTKVWTLDVNVIENPLWLELGIPVEPLIYLQNETIETAFLPKRINLLFHDASHNPEEVLKDLAALIPMIDLGGFLAIHDVAYSRQMGDKVAELFDSMPDQFTYQEISAGCGLGIAKRIAPDPSWDKPVLSAPVTEETGKRLNKKSTRKIVKKRGDKPCKVVASGSAKRKGLGSLRARTEKTSSVTTQESSD